MAAPDFTVLTVHPTLPYWSLTLGNPWWLGWREAVECWVNVYPSGNLIAYATADAAKLAQARNAKAMQRAKVIDQRGRISYCLHIKRKP